ncbi:MAG: hypothetical protein WCK31_03600 [bacterium]
MSKYRKTIGVTLLGISILLLTRIAVESDWLNYSIKTGIKPISKELMHTYDGTCVLKEGTDIFSLPSEGKNPTEYDLLTAGSLDKEIVLKNPLYADGKYDNNEVGASIREYVNKDGVPVLKYSGVWLSLNEHYYASIQDAKCYSNTESITPRLP